MLPVNLLANEILSKKSHSNLMETDQEVDIVDVFRSLQNVLPVVRDAMRRDVMAVWNRRMIKERLRLHGE